MVGAARGYFRRHGTSGVEGYTEVVGFGGGKAFQEGRVWEVVILSAIEDFSRRVRHSARLYPWPSRSPVCVALEELVYAPAATLRPKWSHMDVMCTWDQISCLARQRVKDLPNAGKVGRP